LEFIADESFDFIYIDGDHSYKWALHDITNYWAKVKPGGVLCGHDRSLSGVAQALEEFGKSFTPSEEPQNDSWYILKP
jgi:predicted O-methyltransferase YrrM